jgi:hypothetical protein
MSHQILRRLAIMTSAMFISAAALAADPTIQQVYDTASSGHLDRAQQMMDQVLHDHPASGKAHFVDAELLARQGNLSGAKNELASAEHLEPGLPFAKPAAVQELKSLLIAGSSRRSTNNTNSTSFAPSVSASDAAHGGFSWNIILLVLAAVALFAYFINRRGRTVMQPVASNPSYGGGYSGYSAGTPAYGSGPMMPSGGGMGSGILGSLATGAAVGAGVVAGETLMHRVLDGSGQSAFSSGGSDWSGISSNPVQNYDMGGNDFGLNDDTSWDDSGSSGDDWNRRVIRT